VKPDDYYAWHLAHVVAKLGISDPDGDIVSLKMVDEETGIIAAYCQWGLSSQVYITPHLLTFLLETAWSVTGI
jgi:hypothetical protein